MGIGVGPFLGGMLVNATKDLLSVFYLATFVHFMGALVVWFFIPESLTNQGMNEARRKYKEYQMASTSIWKKMFGFLCRLWLGKPVPVRHSARLFTFDTAMRDPFRNAPLRSSAANNSSRVGS